MYELKEGEKRSIRATVLRVSGMGAIDLTSPQYRILDSAKAVVSGFDWAAAQWDSANNELSAVFDSTIAALSAPGNYFLQLRGTIGAEIYAIPITVKVKDWGP